MAEKRMTHGVVLRLAAVLLILVLLSTCLVAGRYARYTSTVTASDSARVARFEVNETSTLLTESVPISIVPEETIYTEIKVENASEVSVRYAINANNPYHNLPLHFQIKVGDDLHDLPFEEEIKYGQETTYVLVTTWTGGTDISYSGKVDLIEIYLSAAQID